MKLTRRQLRKIIKEIYSKGAFVPDVPTNVQRQSISMTQLEGIRRALFIILNRDDESAVQASDLLESMMFDPNLSQLIIHEINQELERIRLEKMHSSMDYHDYRSGRPDYLDDYSEDIRKLNMLKSRLGI